MCGEDTHAAWRFVVGDRSGRGRRIRPAFPIWLRELDDNVEPSRPNFDEPAVGYEHGCEDVSHLDSTLHRRAAGRSGTKGRLVREARFLLGGARIIGFLLLSCDFAPWRVALVEPDGFRLGRARERIEAKGCHDHPEP